MSDIMNAPLHAIFGTSAGTSAGTENFSVTVLSTSTATPNTAPSVVSNVQDSEYDPELAAHIVELAKARPAAVFSTPKALMDWLEHPRK